MKRDKDAIPKTTNERCDNPFRKRKCGKEDIQLYIVTKGTKHPICHSCWESIANSDHEW